MSNQSTSPLGSSASTTPPANSSASKNSSSSPVAAELPNVPDVWPGAFGVYKYSRQAIMLNIVPLVLVFIVGGLFSSIRILPKIGFIISTIVSLIISTAYYVIYLASVDGKKIEIGDVVNLALKYVVNLVCLSILMALTIGLGFLFFIIPGIILLPRLSLAPYFLIDKDLGIMESFKASWESTKGHSAKVWGIIGASLSMVLLALTIIGIPFSIYFLVMYSAALAILYKFIIKHPSTSSSAISPIT